MKVLLVVLVLVSSCFRESGPKGTLKSYINIRFSSDFEMKEVEDYLTPDFFAQLQHEPVKNRRLKKVKFISENCEDDVCHVTYDISYQVQVEKNTHDSVEVRKVAKLIYLDPLWKIESTMNIKTYLNLKNKLIHN